MHRFSALCFAALAAVGVLGACSGSDGDGSGAGRGGDGGDYGFTVVSADVQAMAATAPAFPPAVSGEITRTLDAWLTGGVVEPMRTGEPSEGLEPTFTAAALSNLATPGANRESMLEDGATVTGDVTQDRADARLTALTGPDGAPVLVTAQVDVGLAVEGDDGIVDVLRTGEVVLVPEGGGWRIDAFDVRTTRDTRLPGRK